MQHPKEAEESWMVSEDTLSLFSQGALCVWWLIVLFYGFTGSVVVKTLNPAIDRLALQIYDTLHCDCLADTGCHITLTLSEMDTLCHLNMLKTKQMCN